MILVDEVDLVQELRDYLAVVLGIECAHPEPADEVGRLVQVCVRECRADRRLDVVSGAISARDTVIPRSGLADAEHRE